MKKNYFKNYKSVVFVIVTSVLFFSCAPQRNMVYFDNLPSDEYMKEQITNARPLTIQPGDELAIKVSTLNTEANVLFNSGGISSNSNAGLSGSLNTGGGTTASGQGYLVDSRGNIDFPVEGAIQVAGLTLEEVEDKVKAAVEKTAKNPIVNVRLINFKISVLGEVSSPGTFNVPNGKINIFEALGLAGDMQDFAVRDNVLVMREKDGVREMQRLNMNDKEVLNSPFFNLQQNDIIYVMPYNKLKTGTTDLSYNSRFLPYFTAALSSVSIIMLILQRARN